MRSRLLIAASAVLLWTVCPPQVASARPSVHLSAWLTPERLGHRSTIGMAIKIADRGTRVPRPVRQLNLRYPNNLGIGLSGLGLTVCTTAALEAKGPTGCPPNSVMGHGTALAVVPFGPELIHESATVTIVRAQDEEGLIALLFDAQGLSPVKANIVLSARLFPSPLPYGGRLSINVPLIPSLPEAPPVSLLSLRATLGPEGLTYYELVEGEEVPYVPKGILLPDSCPHGGFPFAAGLVFQGGARASVQASVRCPARRADTRPR